MKVLHLITQRDQPYGSVRRCCERCGAYGVLGDGTHFYTTDPEQYASVPAGYVRCDDKECLCTNE